MAHGARRWQCEDMAEPRTAAPAEARTVAPPALVALLRALDADVGTKRAADILGISRESFARLVGGLGVRRGTVALVVAWFAARDAAPGGSKPTPREKDEGEIVNDPEGFSVGALKTTSGLLDVVKL